MPRDDKTLWDLFVPTEDARGARAGQVVWAEITQYPKESRSPEGRVVEVLGDADDARLDVEIVIREFGLPNAFPPRGGRGGRGRCRTACAARTWPGGGTSAPSRR